MSHAMALLAGGTFMTAVLKTSSTESGWGFLFILTAALIVGASIAATDERR